jgi:hypothetical protein
MLLSLARVLQPDLSEFDVEHDLYFFSGPELFMSPLSHTEAHVDHQQWQSEVAMWRDDIQQWRKEHEAAQLALTAALASQSDALTQHADAIDKHEKNVAKAEQYIVGCERLIRPVMGAVDRDLSEQHGEELRHQEELREVHERIKKSHFQAITKVGVVVRALGTEL